jgi:hypothetical protein
MRKASCRSAGRVASDHVGIEALGREPDRQEGQLYAEGYEQRGVEQRKPPRKPGAGLG